MGRLSGKVAAITGGASGIGEATARLFAEEGAQVAIADLDAERGRAVADEIRAKHGSALFVETHMEREAEAVNFIRRARAEFGRFDVLVNNAAPVRLAAVDQTFKNPDFWLNRLSALDYRGTDLTEMMGGPQHYEQMTAQEVREAFNRYFTPAARLRFVVVPRS